MTALSTWRDLLAAWAIPDAVHPPESPWVLPREVFLRRADQQIAAPIGVTYQLAAEALQEPGTVLDIGAAAGAASLPLVGRSNVTAVTALDTDDELLAAFAERAAGVEHRLLSGRWPDLADEAGVADVVVCGNVVYNVPDLAPFVSALTAAARRRVVVETAARHPLTELNPLWQRFHGIDRPAGPTAGDCLAALAEVGIEPEVMEWRRPPEPEYAEFASTVDVVRRRLCLPADAAGEVERALLEMGIDPEMPPDLGSSGRDLVTLVWPGSA
ncbi:SAM-dependent methyltransferase [Amycolatopsis sp. A1MSW2902]|uniref:class I SAM-dependent methyltransferase n=1 Tax=Amycolatopsis sp. A1MSW2902 TaxID=687413 RepID=UPI00307D7582